MITIFDTPQFYILIYFDIFFLRYIGYITCCKIMHVATCYVKSTSERCKHVRCEKSGVCFMFLRWFFTEVLTFEFFETVIHQALHTHVCLNIHLLLLLKYNFFSVLGRIPWSAAQFNVQFTGVCCDFSILHTACKFENCTVNFGRNVKACNVICPLPANVSIFAVNSRCEFRTYSSRSFIEQWRVTL